MTRAVVQFGLHASGDQHAAARVKAIVTSASRSFGPRHAWPPSSSAPNAYCTRGLSGMDPAQKCPLDLAQGDFAFVCEKRRHATAGLRGILPMQHQDM
jgi:hypothetical protein